VPSRRYSLRIRRANVLRACLAVRIWLIFVLVSKGLSSYYLTRTISATSRLVLSACWASISATVDGRISVVRRGFVGRWLGFVITIGVLSSFNLRIRLEPLNGFAGLTGLLAKPRSDDTTVVAFTVADGFAPLAVMGFGSLSDAASSVLISDSSLEYTSSSVMYLASDSERIDGSEEQVASGREVSVGALPRAASGFGFVELTAPL